MPSLQLKSVLSINNLLHHSLSLSYPLQRYSFFFSSSHTSYPQDDNERPFPPPSQFFGPRAAPVEIEDPKELAIFKKLISRSTGSFSTSIDERAKGFTDGVRRGKKKMMMMEEEEKEEKELIHPDAPKLAEPEFEGDRNPVTGEVGGPKVEPLKWGGEGEWTYNGRATDF